KRRSVCGAWSVTTENQCFLRGTSAVIQCSYDYPYWHSVRKVEWLKYSSDQRLQVLTSDRFEFVGDKRYNCNLRINNIRHTDEGLYTFRFETNWDKWTSRWPVRISVKDLIASVQPPTMTEGEVVTLTCRSGCNTQTDVQSVWFREGQQMSNIKFKASKEDAGRYTCALLGQDRIQSNAVSLIVQYAPKNVMLSMSPSDDIMLGSSLIFSCSCEANPPVAHSGYSLFKDGHFISDGPNHIISEVQLSDSGQYYCQAGNSITWTGSRLFQSSTTHVNVQYPPMNVSILVDSAEVTEGSVVNMTCHSNGNPPAFGYTWYRIDSASPSVFLAGSGPVLSLSPVEAFHSGLYMCHTWNRHGENNSTMLLLSVKTKDCM
uniref:Ig-like domain-containing protein n=1 Tax=Neogobius melanostomus TaxID=47308 RepID=A0A8C6SCR6_9GOBI